MSKQARRLIALVLGISLWAGASQARAADPPAKTTSVTYYEVWRGGKKFSEAPTAAEAQKVAADLKVVTGTAGEVRGPFQRQVPGNGGGGNTTSGSTTGTSTGQGPYKPSFGVSLIPIVGSALEAKYDFQTGHPVWGVINTALAISDVFLVKSIVTAAGKVLVKGAGEVIVREGAQVAAKDAAELAARKAAEEAAAKKAAEEAAILAARKAAEEALETQLAKRFGQTVVDALKATAGANLGQSLRDLEKVAQALDKLQPGVNLATRERATTKLIQDVFGNSHWVTNGYQQAELLRDLSKLTDVPGFLQAVRRLKQTGAPQVLGNLYEIQVAAKQIEQLANAGKVTAEIGKDITGLVNKGGQLVKATTDADLVINGTYYQLKRTAGAFGSLPEVKRWVEIVRSSGVPPDKIKYVTQAGEKVSPAILNWLEQQGIQVLRLP